MRLDFQDPGFWPYKLGKGNPVAMFVYYGQKGRFLGSDPLQLPVGLRVGFLYFPSDVTQF